MNATLPDLNKQALIPEHFPTSMQAFIFRNWEMVSKERIALVLGTSVENVEREAQRMGLKAQGNTDIWMEKGYITIIRANWHLLPYTQLLELLGWTAEELAFVLKEEDFLNIKLGMIKPISDPIRYAPLTEAEMEATRAIRTVVESVPEPEDGKEPFDFWSSRETKARTKTGQPGDDQICLDESWHLENVTGDERVDVMAARFADAWKRQYGVKLGCGKNLILLRYIENQKEEYHKLEIEDSRITITAGGSAGILRGLYRLEDLAQAEGGPYLSKGTFERTPRFDTRYIYSFCALYGTALDVDSSTWCPDSLLEKYARVGVNGIWLQAVLYRLTEFPFDPEISEGWQERQKNLRIFVERAASYGIKIFLYINEPRTMPLAFFDKYPEMKGAVSGKYACMCLSTQEAQEYLSGAVERLCRAIPGLGGFFTITMSENLTHCKSREVDEACPHCADKEPWELAALANRLIAEGAHRGDPDVQVIAWDWGWSPDFKFREGDVLRCIQAIPSDVAIMSKRETELPFTRAGVEGIVRDYSLSVEGLSKVSLETWQAARESGHEPAAKLQINNTWECSTTPYLPVFGILEEIMNDMMEQNVRHLMLGWTLGGYPSPGIRYISEAFFRENDQERPDYGKCLEILYGEQKDRVKQATDKFCKAFREFPFDLDVLYNGPQNGGVSNPFYSRPTGYQATMTCFAYDDLEGWRSIYSEQQFEDQFKKLSEGWEEGMRLLDQGTEELWDISYVSYSLFRSSYHQVRFVRLRDTLLGLGTDKTCERQNVIREILEILQKEKEMTREVYGIMKRRPEVGFEAANHYYFSLQMLLEKVVNCEHLIRYYGELE